MTDRKQALADLLEKVEDGEQPQPKDFRAALEVPMQDMRYTQMPNDARAAYGGNLNSAQALHEAVLPRWDCMMKWSSPAWVDLWERGDIETANRPIRGTADGLARAWLIAILKALIARESKS